MDTEAAMRIALDAAARVRTSTSPNPWVGCALVVASGAVFVGATEPPGGRHAEIVALDAARAAGETVAGATAVVTLEPCAHWGRTPPCTDALIRAGVSRVVYALDDPDPHVAGRGAASLAAAGVAVEAGVCRQDAAEQLAPYLHHRRTGRPFVVVKAAATLDGATAAVDGSSQWITGPAARADGHRLRAESDAVLVGGETLRADDPALTVRAMPCARQPLRVVLSHQPVPPDARAQPCEVMSGPLEAVLNALGRRGVLQLLVEGGATVASAFHRAGLVQRYVFYLAPALAGGRGGRGVFTGDGAPSIDAFWRGTLRSVDRLGDDVRVVVEPAPQPPDTINNSDNPSRQERE